MTKQNSAQQDSINFFQQKIQSLQSMTHAMFMTQHENNILTKGPEYLSLRLNWIDAIFAEAGELIESTGYKWWKKTDLDVENCKTELVDIWHFLMSMFINRTHNSADAEELIKRMVVSNSNLFGPIHQSEETLTRMFEGHVITGEEISYQTKKLVKRVLNNEEPQVVILAFIDIMTALNLSFNELYTRYMIKNALNRLRQRNGYTEGTYRKTWMSPLTRIPVEDNYAALGLVMGKNFSNVEEVVDILQAYYNDPKSVVSDKVKK